MRKNSLIALAFITGLVISMAACRLGEDIDTLEKNASKANLGDTVNIAAIQGVTAPMYLRDPVKSITANNQYTGEVSWSPDVTLSNNKFDFDVQYTATITLTANKGYTLYLVGADFFTVSGATSVTNSANSGVITAKFPKAREGIVDLAAIPLAVPTPGGTPVTAISETAQYSGTVTWSPAVSGTFEANTQYTATITLTAKPKFTLQGVTANFFTVNGATTVINSANAGVVTATFPQTKSVIPDGGPNGRIEYYWVDRHGSLVTTSGGATSLITGSSLTITPAGTGYEVKKWYVNGVDTGQSGDTYNFSITTIGKHTVDLFLEKDDILYSTSITIDVVSNELTLNKWASGNIATSTGEMWFKFTATASTQYIHVNFGTLTNLNVQVYNSSDTAVGSQANLYGSNKNTSRSVTSGQTYYIKVTPSYSSGTYQIAFNTSSTAPSTGNSNEASPIPLSDGTWTTGSITSTASGSAIWYSFIVTNGTTYRIWWNDSDGNGSYLFDVRVDASYSDSTVIFSGDSGYYSVQSFTANRTGTVKLKVYPVNSGNTGTFAIVYSTGSTRPSGGN